MHVPETSSAAVFGDDADVAGLHAGADEGVQVVVTQISEDLGGKAKSEALISPLAVRHQQASSASSLMIAWL